MKGGVKASQNQDDYQWYEMGFHLCVRPGGVAVAFCFETPSIFQENLRQALSATVRAKAQEDGMAALQCLIVEEVVKLYDVSIWTLRNEIRDIEKVRLPVCLSRSATGQELTIARDDPAPNMLPWLWISPNFMISHVTSSMPVR
jgi:hypothetical protein